MSTDNGRNKRKSLSHSCKSMLQADTRSKMLRNNSSYSHATADRKINQQRNTNTKGVFGWVRVFSVRY